MQDTAVTKRAKHAAGSLAARLAHRLSPAEAPEPAPESAEASQFEPREEIDNKHLELLIGWWLRADSNCVDVGANEGRFLSHMINRAPRGRHYAFEPIPSMADRLRADYPDVEVRCSALYDEPGEAEFVLVPELPGYSGLRERAYPKEVETQRIKVTRERLDDVLPEDYVPHMIKVDVEGAELQVFRGALRTLQRHHPLVVFEHGPGAADRYGTTPDEVHALLTGEVGFRIYDMDADGPLSRERFAELFNAGARWNYVALP